MYDPEFSPETFSRVWKSAGDAQTATKQLSQLYKLPAERVLQLADALVQAGDIEPLPVFQEGTELSAEAIYEFCVTWTRHMRAADVAQALGLPIKIVLDRYSLLTDLGMNLRPKPDMGRAPKRPVGGSVGLSKINEALSVEILVREALLKEKQLKRNLGAALTLLSQARTLQAQLDTSVQQELDAKLHSIVALLREVFTELGLVE